MPTDKTKSKAPTAALIRKEPLPPAGYASDEKRRHAAILFAHGIGYTSAAQILGLKTATVRDWSRSYAAGRFNAKVPKRLYRYTPETKEYCMQLRRDGWSWNAIRQTTGVSPTSVRNWLLQAGEEVTPRKPAPTGGAPQKKPAVRPDRAKKRPRRRRKAEG